MREHRSKSVHVRHGYLERDIDGKSMLAHLQEWAECFVDHVIDGKVLFEVLLFIFVSTRQLSALKCLHLEPLTLCGLVSRMAMARPYPTYAQLDIDGLEEIGVGSLGLLASGKFFLGVSNKEV